MGANMPVSTNKPQLLRSLIIAVFVGLAWLGSSAPGAAQELWRGAAAGMTVEEVQAVHPSATRGDGDRLHNGALALLRMEGFAINQVDAEAEFYFLNSRLHQVVVRPLRLGPGLRTSNIALARTIAGLITQRYGEPYECGATMPGFSCSWNTARLNIALIYIDLRESAPIMNINYRLKPTGLDENL